MNVTEAAYKTSIRMRGGNPSTTDVPDAMVAEALAAGLRMYGMYRGPQVVRTFFTVAGDPEYQLDADLLTVEEVVWEQGGGMEGDIFTLENRSVLNVPFESLTGLDTFLNPSLLNIVYQQIEDFRAQFGGRWELFEGPTGGELNVRLSPSPDAVVRVAVIGRVTPTIANVPQKDYEILMEACLARLFEMRVNSVSTIQSVSFGGGSISFGVAELSKAATDHEGKFRSMVGAGAAFISRG